MKEYKAGIYLRLSKEDDNPNNSISAQRDIILNYARKNNFNVVKEYIDNGWYIGNKIPYKCFWITILILIVFYYFFDYLLHLKI